MTAQFIPLVDLNAQYQSLKDELRAAAINVMDRGDFILGEDVNLFEEQFAKYLSVKHAIGCGSGTDALVLALRTLEIGLGDEVIVPAMTFIATAPLLPPILRTLPRTPAPPLCRSLPILMLRFSNRSRERKLRIFDNS